VGAALPADWRRPVNADRKSRPAAHARATSVGHAAAAGAISRDRMPAGNNARRLSVSGRRISTTMTAQEDLSLLPSRTSGACIQPAWHARNSGTALTKVAS
jgi:hypothetical protein